MPTNPHPDDALPIHVYADRGAADPDAPEFRRDPVTGRWVIIAPERSRRPLGLSGAKPKPRADGERNPCPFCPGHEALTPHEVLAHRDPGTPADGPGWQLRVVPNMYPAVRPTDGDAGAKSGELFERLPGVGRHEVVIECPEHNPNPAHLTDAQFAGVLTAYRDRLLAFADDPRLAYGMVFKNVGAEAGASLGHCHSQILATPLVPDAIRQELSGASDYYTRNRRCVFCDVVAADTTDGRRLVARTDAFVAVAPFAPRFAYEVWVLPADHGSRFEAITTPRAAELAGLMKRVVGALDAVLDEPAYNWFLHAGPLRAGELPYFHWHFEVMPRTSRPAGFEWGGGSYINSVPPEAAAERLRAVLT